MEEKVFSLPQYEGIGLSLYISRTDDHSIVQLVNCCCHLWVVATLSVENPEVRLGAGEFVFKTTGGNEGLLEQLIDAGVIERVGFSVPVGMAGMQPVCRICE
jgi:hypothetical protein